MKKLLKLFCVLLLVVAAMGNVYGEEQSEHTTKADALKEIGLFSGTALGYELERAPTRLESAVMLVRLLGKEAEAKKTNAKHPFTDVPTWANPYVGYMYANKLSAGIGNNLFGSDQLVDAQSFATFVLRALGYSDAKGDFTWATALDYAVTQKVINEAEKSNVIGQSFLRDEMVFFSYSALKANLKGSQDKLVDRLIKDNAINVNKAYNSGFVDGTKYDKELTPKVILSGEINNLVFGKEYLFKAEKNVSIYYAVNGDNFQLSVPVLDGWNGKIVGKVECYNGTELTKILYTTIETMINKHEAEVNYLFTTPFEKFTKIKYSFFEVNDYFIQKTLLNNKVTVHRIPWANKEDAQPLFEKAAYLQTQSPVDKGIKMSDTMWIARSIFANATYYPNKAPFISELSMQSDKMVNTNIYKNPSRLLLENKEFDFKSSEQWISQVSVSSADNITYCYIINNTTQICPFIIRDANYKITDLVFFTN